jgi:uncharacterized protein
MRTLVRAGSDAGVAPVANAERVAVLDVVRGFTLYGVLLANTVPWFSGRGYLPKADALAKLGTADEVALFFLAVFVSRKSQTLLTCLFGLGFAVTLARVEARGGNAVRLYLRRLATLLGIGMAHAAFVWWGDVLWGYALTGGALLLFRRRSDRALVAWAAALIFVPSFLTQAPSIAAFLKRVVPGPADHAAFDAELLRACLGTNYAHLVEKHTQRGFYYFWSHAAEYIPWMIGHFLIGYLVGKNRALESPSRHLPRWQKLFAWCLACGLAGGALSALKGTFVRHGGIVSTRWKLALIVPEQLGILAMAFAYVAGLVLLMERPSWRRRLMVLAPVGRMALTTYLSQSVIMTFLFYGWGLGLMLRVGPALCVPLTLAVFAVQIVVARAWLRHFSFGPMEWVWRRLTYGQRPLAQRTSAA